MVIPRRKSTLHIPLIKSSPPGNSLSIPNCRVGQLWRNAKLVSALRQMQILNPNSLMKTLLVARRVIIKIVNMEYEKNKYELKIKIIRLHATMLNRRSRRIFFFGRKPVKITTNRTPKKSRLLEN